jgi:hypothetical protein
MAQGYGWGGDFFVFFVNMNITTKKIKKVEKKKHFSEIFFNKKETKLCRFVFPKKISTMR